MIDDLRLTRIRHDAGCTRSCALVQSYRITALAVRFTHNGVRASESVDADHLLLKTTHPDQIEAMLSFWCREIHAGRKPGPRGYEMPVEHDGRTDIVYIPVAVD